MTRRNLLIALSGIPSAVIGKAFADNSGAKPGDKFAQAHEDVRDLMLLMDANKDGKISKKEWISFMEAEFNQLDKDGNGELDRNELLQSRLRPRK
jgi:Ca2+-binding EF-hand superfamily protein